MSHWVMMGHRLFLRGRLEFDIMLFIFSISFLGLVGRLDMLLSFFSSPLSLSFPLSD